MFINVIYTCFTDPFSIMLTPTLGIPGGPMKKNPSANAGDAGLILGSRRSPGKENGNPPQDSCLGNPIDRGAWQATVHGLVKS